VMPDADLAAIIKKEIDFTPKGIVARLKLLQPIYQKTASYGHFGRNEKEFTWEKTDLVPLLKKLAK
jgi:S-adenosylmethionine synthetase